MPTSLNTKCVNQCVTVLLLAGMFGYLLSPLSRCCARKETSHERFLSINRRRFLCSTILVLHLWQLLQTLSGRLFSYTPSRFSYPLFWPPQTVFRYRAEPVNLFRPRALESVHMTPTSLSPPTVLTKSRVIATVASFSISSILSRTDVVTTYFFFSFLDPVSR